jgi:hypothetical protein
MAASETFENSPNICSSGFLQWLYRLPIHSIPSLGAVVLAQHDVRRSLGRHVFDASESQGAQIQSC